MKYIATLFALVVFLTANGASAEPSCSDSFTGTEVAACGANAIKEDERKLSTTYQELLSKLPNECASRYEGLKVGCKKYLEDSQREWAEYRDAQCALQAEIHGKSYGWKLADEATCMGALTRERINVIQGLLHYEP